MNNVERLGQLLQTSFGPLVEQAARESCVIQRKRKFDPASLAKTFILALLAKPTANDQDIAQMAISLDVAVTPQAIEQRYNHRANKFFRALFDRICTQVFGSDSTLAPILGRFTSVKLIDSSTITLPESMAQEFAGCGGTDAHPSAALKVQTELDLATGQLQCVQLEPGKSPDQGTDRQWITPEKGSLRIADLGYFCLAMLCRYDQCGAYFLSRLLYNSTIQVDPDHPYEGLKVWSIGLVVKNNRSLTVSWSLARFIPWPAV